MAKIWKLVFTGGPCGGKTKALQGVSRALREKGYTVLAVPEGCTVLQGGGAARPLFADAISFQAQVFGMQRMLEERFLRAAVALGQEKTVLLCDRGRADGRAYCTEEEYGEILRCYGTDLAGVMAEYDAVFHLESTAVSAPAFYRTGAGTVRTETVEEARLLDGATAQAWAVHPQRVRIGCAATFEEKKDSLVKAVLKILQQEI